MKGTEKNLETIKLGYCFTGSYCTFSKSIETLEILSKKAYDIYPIMSEHAYSTDTRFGKAKDHIARIEELCKKPILHKIEEVEPIGPKKFIDVLAIVPCTGNTMSKLSNGITDTCVIMAAKASLRNSIPVVIGLATNDGLSQSAKNLGILLATKNVYFVPLGQDSPIKKPTSLVCDFSMIESTIECALKGEQIQPLIF